jgi:two-component system, OmpR family, alkaline phosphatase synthesis response regulator PhoP
MGKKIIVVDDESTIRDSLQEFLIEKGFDVLQSSDGESGYDLIAQENPDLLIIDILLPKIDGIDLCGKIRKNIKLKHIPIILMTGIYMDFNFRLKIQRGIADDFIVKPLKYDEILTKIDKLLNPDD